MRSFTGVLIAAVVVLIAAATILASCSVRDDVFIAADGSGEVRFSVELTPFLLQTLQDIASMSGDSGDSLVLDAAKVRESFAKQDLVTLTRLEQPDPSALSGAFTFDSVNKIFQDGTTPAAGGRWRTPRRRPRPCQPRRTP